MCMNRVKILAKQTHSLGFRVAWGAEEISSLGRLFLFFYLFSWQTFSFPLPFASHPERDGHSSHFGHLDHFTSASVSVCLIEQIGIFQSEMQQEIP